jgi:diacylglycerol kinase family enzyme
MAGAGFDAEVVRPGWRAKRRLGYLAYLYAAARTLISPPRADLRVVIDGLEIRCRGMGVEVANMPGLSAPGFPRPVRVVPGGRLDDGRLDVCILGFESRTDLVRALVSILTGRAGRDPRLRYHRGREIRVETRPALQVQADGERFGITPFTAVVQHGALSVVVPDRASPSAGRTVEASAGRASRRRTSEAEQ